MSEPADSPKQNPRPEEVAAEVGFLIAAVGNKVGNRALNSLGCELSTGRELELRRRHMLTQNQPYN
jgi:hypothetical protein